MGFSMMNDIYCEFNPYRVGGISYNAFRRFHLRLLLFNPFRIVRGLKMTLSSLRQNQNSERSSTIIAVSETYGKQCWVKHEP